MRGTEIVVVSGKGGTGKTTIVSSLIPYLEAPVLADCDVDAPNLHLLLAPDLVGSEEFHGLCRPRIDESRCSHCGLCRSHCRFGALTGEIRVERLACEGCGVCALVCPAGAVSMVPERTGSILWSDTEYGPLFHASLLPGEETSGRLVAEVRRRAQARRDRDGARFLLVDGAPGVGCAVISSLTGADLALLITEPTCSGLHDLARIHELAKGFGVPCALILNKADLSMEGRRSILQYSGRHALPVLLEIPFAPEIANAVRAGRIPSQACPGLFREIGFQTLAGTLSRGVPAV